VAPLQPLQKVNSSFSVSNESTKYFYVYIVVVLEAEPYYKFAIPVQSYVGEAKEEGLKCTLVFKYTEKYPEEPPIIEIQDEDFDEIDVLIKHLQEQVGIFLK
jgi:hypothetical protein